MRNLPIHRNLVQEGVLMDFHEFVFSSKVRNFCAPSIGAILALFVAGCESGAKRDLGWQGVTMGTTYTVKVAGVAIADEETSVLKADIDTLLESINDQMSTYRPESEISRFNRSISTDPFLVSPEFGYVLGEALKLSEQMGAAFEPTLDPLINLWGFGDRGRADVLPDDTAIDHALQKVGYHHLERVGGGRLVKKLPALQLNLNAIAKGYGVDLVAALLVDRGMENIFVEIGGEIVAKGRNPDGRVWTIGIETPTAKTGPGQSFETIVQLDNKAIATSGNYRNFVTDKDGKRLSHIVDPRTGRPVDHLLASVSVIADTCLLADGVATGLFVMGASEGLEWVESNADVEALFIVARPEGGFEQLTSSGFKGLDPSE